MITRAANGVMRCKLLLRAACLHCPDNETPRASVPNQQALWSPFRILRRVYRLGAIGLPQRPLCFPEFSQQLCDCFSIETHDCFLPFGVIAGRRASVPWTARSRRTSCYFVSDKGLRCRRDRNRPAIALELVVEHGGRVEDAGFACREHAAIVDVARKARNRLDLYGCAKPVSILPLLPIGGRFCSP